MADAAGGRKSPVLLPGLFSGDLEGREALEFHARELRRALRFYGCQATPMTTLAR